VTYIIFLKTERVVSELSFDSTSGLTWSPFHSSLAGIQFFRYFGILLLSPKQMRGRFRGPSLFFFFLLFDSSLTRSHPTKKTLERIICLAKEHQWVGLNLSKNWLKNLPENITTLESLTYLKYPSFSLPSLSQH